MNKAVINAFLVLGFCVGTVGAAGFDKKIESEAWYILAAGVALIVIGGVLHRKNVAGNDNSEMLASGKAEFQSKLNTIRDKVIAMDDARGGMTGKEATDRIDALLREEYFDLTSRNDELIALLGFSNYARVWEGVAIAERLLARTWSFATDGHLEEGLNELPSARQYLEDACAALQAM